MVTVFVSTANDRQTRENWLQLFISADNTFIGQIVIELA
jgi:hypothetical protein